jgi:hypothetical protein
LLRRAILAEIPENFKLMGWMAPSRHLSAKMVVVADSDEAGHAFQSEAGHLFQREAGRDSDLKPATTACFR